MCDTVESAIRNCYYPAEKPRFFVVESGQGDWVTILVRRVREMLLAEYGLNISHDDLQLFKACFLSLVVNQLTHSRQMSQ